MGMQPETWAVILAGGEGTRLAGLTHALYGYAIPKQYAVLFGEKSLLQVTLDRVATLVPPRRTIVVATRGQELLARDQLVSHPGVELLVQPRGLDTAAGILLPVSRILTRGEHARVIVFPADHYVRDGRPFRHAVRAAESAWLIDPSRLALVGAVPETAETEYGWIVPGRCLSPDESPARTVERFIEKPQMDVAAQLLESGALWNTFISAGPVRTFWELAERHLPEHAHRMRRYMDSIGSPYEDAELDRLYRCLTPAGFSRAVLEPASARLSVVPMAGSGWCDWGSPARVFESLRGSSELEDLVARVGGRAALARCSRGLQDARDSKRLHGEEVAEG